jgi:CheY-like chemotaxis protein/anti-sigma regulatory factor (Ser/Thr protein kinase)
VLLRQRNPPAEMERPLATIERNARLQTKLIEDVLDISRIISGKLVLNLGALKIKDAIAAAVETVAPSAAASEIRIATHVPDEDLTLVADPDRLQQVVWNLLSNAVKFTPRGGQIDVRAERRGSDICVTVADTGEGIRRSVLPFLFEPFRQADASTARRHGGLGLGLAIVRQLVLAHGGTVRADSEGEGKGAIFTVLLPERAAVPAFRGTSAAAARARRISDEIPRLDGLRLLIVDDERDALQLLSEALGDLGAIVHTAASAREALDALSRLQVDLLVSDISMPDMDGLALMRQLRQRAASEGGSTPAIALTAFTRDQDVQRALGAGYQLHLSKPVDIGPLARAILRLARPDPS